MTKLYRSSGTEATCPKCYGGNAMLSREKWNEKENRRDTTYTCRDCGYTVVNPDMIEVEYEELITRYRNGVDNLNR